MGDVANKDEASKALDVARAAVDRGDFDKARRFADKAKRLYPNDEVRILLQKIKSRQASPGPSSAGAPYAHQNGFAAGANGPGVRHRPTAAQEAAARDASATPEQRQLVAQILAHKNHYDVLGLQTDASDEDIKRAYRKLALKLHPDKNKAHKADEAFKAVSKAFSCLSDGNNRAHYDRYGEEEDVGRRASQGGGSYGQADFDPDEIFNMFFGGGSFGGRGPVFRANFGGGRPGMRAQQAGPREPVNPMMQLAQLLPVILIMLLTFWGQTASQPAWSINQSSNYREQMVTSQYSIPYYVKLAPVEFEKKYPQGSRSRLQLEQEAEMSFRRMLEQGCYEERLQQQYAWRRGRASGRIGLWCLKCQRRLGNPCWPSS
ncbi:hypothetical protein WJX74_006707 [Apatococcus lobatus]|uniref:J domain-containing protein n=1 Tax=Apatococcus lobatus TaxID=904363 RepID=A0AAW1RLJ0_9CHLO